MADDADLAHPCHRDIYQLRAVIGQISPLIWRRLLVAGETTIAGLHAIVQTAFDWSGEHLHRFRILGTEYGIYTVGGPWFRDDAHTVRLWDLDLRPRERFSYEYNFFAGWQVSLRVEQIRPAEPGKVYPRCTAGRRAGPPEGWDGPWEFLKRTQPSLVFSALLRAAEIMGQLLDADEDDQLANVIGADRDELAALLPLLGLELFDRRACNKALATCTADTVEGSR
jgi:pRiA4b ORF-3-like protein